jgi:putative ABC transport system substrate-binding protein
MISFLSIPGSSASTPGDLPVEQPTKFLVVINVKTARELGLNLSPSLVAQTDQLIE